MENILSTQEGENRLHCQNQYKQTSAYMKNINVLILDTQPLVREKLAILIGASKFKTRVLQSNSISEASQLLKNNEIELILLDVNLKDGSGLDFVRRLKIKGYNGSILFISSLENPIYNQAAKTSGANGYILKTEETALINDAIWAIYQGYTLFKSKSHLITKEPALSNRESVVLGYLSQGYSNKQISEMLHLSTKTISTYKSRILEKHSASSIIEIINTNEIYQL